MNKPYFTKVFVIVTLLLDKMRTACCSCHCVRSVRTFPPPVRSLSAVRSPTKLARQSDEIDCKSAQTRTEMRNPIQFKRIKSTLIKKKGFESIDRKGFDEIEKRIRDSQFFIVDFSFVLLDRGIVGRVPLLREIAAVSSFLERPWQRAPVHYSNFLSGLGMR